jgi:chloramphenicol 3-O phosphotransferase
VLLNGASSAGKTTLATAFRDQHAVSVGGVGRQLLRAYQGGVRAAAQAGLNVIVDEVVIDEMSWSDWAAALRGLDAVWVGVCCSAAVAEERERARGDRYRRLASVQTITAREHAEYSFEIDTTTHAPDDAVQELSQRLGY